MRNMLGFALGMAVAFAASSASAGNVQGTIENIDPVARTILVDGKVYQIPEETTGGISIEELKAGDKVDMTVKDEDRGDESANQPVLMIEKIEE
jgi:hypothetical protein